MDDAFLVDDLQGLANLEEEAPNFRLTKFCEAKVRFLVERVVLELIARPPVCYLDEWCDCCASCFQSFEVL